MEHKVEFYRSSDPGCATLRILLKDSIVTASGLRLCGPMEKERASSYIL